MWADITLYFDFETCFEKTGDAFVKRVITQVQNNTLIYPFDIQESNTGRPQKFKLLKTQLPDRINFEH